MKARLNGESALALFESSLVARNYAADTIKHMRRVVVRFWSSARKPVDRMDRQDVRYYLAERGRTIATNTLATELDVIDNFFRTMIDAELLTRNPTDELLIKRTRVEPQLLLSEEDVTLLLEASSVVLERGQRTYACCKAVALRNRAVIELAYGTAMRASEVCAVRVVDLVLDQGAVLCRRVKRGISAHLPLPQASLPHLSQYLSEGRPHLVRGDGRDEGRFLLTERGRPLRVMNIEEIVETVSIRAGVTAHPHAFRRATATHLARRGACIVAVQELLGHVRMDTTQKYVEVERDDVKKAVSVLEADGAFRSGKSSSSRSGAVPWVEEGRRGFNAS